MSINAALEMNIIRNLNNKYLLGKYCKIIQHLVISVYYVPTLCVLQLFYPAKGNLGMLGVF